MAVGLVLGCCGATCGNIQTCIHATQLSATVPTGSSTGSCTHRPQPAFIPVPPFHIPLCIGYRALDPSRAVPYEPGCPSLYMTCPVQQIQAPDHPCTSTAACVVIQDSPCSLYPWWSVLLSQVTSHAHHLPRQSHHHHHPSRPPHHLPRPPHLHPRQLPRSHLHLLHLSCRWCSRTPGSGKPLPHHDTCYIFVKLLHSDTPTLLHTSCVPSPLTCWLPLNSTASCLVQCTPASG
jgi:hypothetical protein